MHVTKKEKGSVRGGYFLSESLSHEGWSCRIQKEESSSLLPIQSVREGDMVERGPIGVISIGSNDIHLLVATSDGITTFERHVNQSMLAELVGAVKGGVVPVKALSQALQDIEILVNAARAAGTNTILAIATEAMREVANGPTFIELVGCTLGIKADLISGQEEAALDYCWATFP